MRVAVSRFFVAIKSLLDYSIDRLGPNPYTLAVSELSSKPGLAARRVKIRMHRGGRRIHFSASSHALCIFLGRSTYSYAPPPVSVRAFQFGWRTASIT